MIFKCKKCGSIFESDGYLHGTPCPNCGEKKRCWEKLDKQYKGNGGRPKGSKNKKGTLPRGFELRKYFRNTENLERTIDWWYGTGQIKSAEYSRRKKEIENYKKYLTRTKK